MAARRRARSPPTGRRSPIRGAGRRRRRRCFPARIAPASPGPGSSGNGCRAGCCGHEREWLCWTKGTSIPARGPVTRPGRSRPGTPGSRRGPPARAAPTPSSLVCKALRHQLEGLAVLAQVVVAVLARAQRPPPLLVVAIPVDGPLDALLEGDRRLPAEADRASRRRASSGDRGRGGRARARSASASAPVSEMIRLDHLDVRKLVGPADVVGLARHPALEDDVDRRGEVLDEEPVAHLRAVAVDRDRVAVERVEDGQRDQLLRVLARPVVVGGADDQRVGAEGVLEGGDDQVATGLRGGVGRGRVERRGLGEGALLDRAVDLVGGDLQVADAEVASGLEQDVGAEDVGGDELARGSRSSGRRATRRRS